MGLINKIKEKIGVGVLAGSMALGAVGCELTPDQLSTAGGLINKQVAQQWRQDGQKGAELWDLAGDYQLIQGQRGHERNVAERGRTQINIDNRGHSGGHQRRADKGERKRRWKAGQWVDHEDNIYGKYERRMLGKSILERRGEGWFMRDYIDPRTGKSVDFRAFVVCNYVKDLDGDNVIDLVGEVIGIKDNFSLDEKITIYSCGTKKIDTPSFWMYDGNGDLVDQHSNHNSDYLVHKSYNPVERSRDQIGRYRVTFNDAGESVSVRFEVTE
jgi:hypothetical protein